MSINAIAGSPSAPLEHCRRRARLLMGAAAFLLTATAVGAPADAPGTRPDLKPIDVFDLQWVADPQISPDGRSIAYVRMSMDIKTDRPQRVIWLTGIDGKNTRPLSGPPPRACRAGLPTAPASPISLRRATGRPSCSCIGSAATSPPRSAISRNRQRASPGLPTAAGSPSRCLCPRSARPLKVELPQAPKGANWADPPKLIDRMVYRIDGEGYLPASFSQLFVIATDGGAARQLTHGDFDHDGHAGMERRQQVAF